MRDDYGRSFTREHHEADWLSNDPHRDVIDRAQRNHEEMLFADAEPRVFSRGETIKEKDRLIEAIAKKLGVEQEYDAWLQARRRQADKMAEFYAEQGEESKRVPYDLGPMPLERSGAIGEMWYASATSAVLPGETAVAWLSDGIRLRGRVSRNNGDLRQGTMLLVSLLYVLSPDRMPAVGPGRPTFTSSPYCQFVGTLVGNTGDHSGDNWSKCWLIASQTVRGGPQGAIIGTAAESRNLINLSQDDQHQVADLPVRMAFPVAFFGMNRETTRHPLTITLDLRFTFQLEGIANLAFMPYETILRLWQWTIVKASL